MNITFIYYIVGFLAGVIATRIVTRYRAVAAMDRLAQLLDNFVDVGQILELYNKGYEVEEIKRRIK